LPLYIANLVPPDCIIVVVYGSLVDVHNLRSQSWLVGRLYLAWRIDPTGRYGYRIRILGCPSRDRRLRDRTGGTIASNPVSGMNSKWAQEFSVNMMLYGEVLTLSLLKTIITIRRITSNAIMKMVHGIRLSMNMICLWKGRMNKCKLAYKKYV